jgi:hypothetical protein
VSTDPESGATIPEGASAPFPDPGETAQDYDAQAQAEVLTQYKESPKLKATITALMSGWQAIEDCLVTIPGLRDPDVATGVNLDRVGELVGQSRVLTTGTELDDADYRVFIALRILRNRSIGSGPEFVAALEAILDPIPFRFVDLGGMAVLVEIATGAPPTDDQIAALDHGPVPRAMAVGVGRVWYDPDSVFGFDGDDEALGFGEIGDPDPGGNFAEIF